MFSRDSKGAWFLKAEGARQALRFLKKCVWRRHQCRPRDDGGDGGDGDGGDRRWRWQLGFGDGIGHWDGDGDVMMMVIEVDVGGCYLHWQNCVRLWAASDLICIICWKRDLHANSSQVVVSCVTRACSPLIPIPIPIPITTHISPPWSISSWMTSKLRLTALKMLWRRILVCHFAPLPSPIPSPSPSPSPIPSDQYHHEYHRHRHPIHIIMSSSCDFIRAWWFLWHRHHNHHIVPSASTSPPQLPSPSPSLSHVNSNILRLYRANSWARWSPWWDGGKSWSFEQVHITQP